MFVVPCSNKTCFHPVLREKEPRQNQGVLITKIALYLDCQKRGAQSQDPEAPEAN